MWCVGFSYPFSNIIKQKSKQSTYKAIERFQDSLQIPYNITYQKEFCIQYFIISIFILYLSRVINCKLKGNKITIFVEWFYSSCRFKSWLIWDVSAPSFSVTCLHVSLPTFSRVLCWLGRSPGDGNGNPPQYSCLENPMDRGVRRVIVLGVAKSLTWLSDWAHVGTGGGDELTWGGHSS